MAGITMPPEMIMLANIYDAITGLAYGLAGGKGTKPESVAERFINEDEQKDNKKMESFESGADFEKRRKELLQKIHKE